MATNELKKLADEIRQCNKCDLAKTRKSVVVGRGSFTPKIVFIGEAPGKSEDEDFLKTGKHSRTFCGKSGELLSIWVKYLGLSEKDYAICNIAKCRPTDINGHDRPPTPQEIAACSPFLEQQLALLKPQYIIALGATAARYFVDINNLLINQGKIFIDEKDRKIIVLAHPSYWIRNGGKGWEPYLDKVKIIFNMDVDKTIADMKKEFEPWEQASLDDLLAWEKNQHAAAEEKFSSHPEETSPKISPKAEEMFALKKPVTETKKIVDIDSPDGEKTEGTGKQNFVHLHAHTEYSILDGAGRIEDFIVSAKKKGFTALAISDHRTISGWKSFNDICKANDIKPIFGVELDIVQDMKIKNSKTKQPRSHLVLLAKNEIGMKNIMKITSEAWLEGFYYMPRADLEFIRQHKEGLICLTACLKSLLNKDQVAIHISELSDIFGENLYLEMQFNELEEQKIFNRRIYELSKEYNLPIVITNDVHYAEKDDWKAQDVLLCIRHRQRLDTPDRKKYTTHDLYLKTREEMLESYKRDNGNDFPIEEIEEALNNSITIADKCNAEPKYQNLMPQLNESFPTIKNMLLELNKNDVRIEGSIYEYTLQKILREAMEKRGFAGKEEYENRLATEFEVIKKANFVKYFLIVHRIYQFAKEKKLYCGAGRGSVAGSLCANLLGITQIDPIKYNLMFERFISPSRKSGDLPDVDMDFCSDERAIVKNYLEELYGKEKVAAITNYGKLKEKVILHDLGRVMGISRATTGEIIRKTEEYMNQITNTDARKGNVLRIIMKEHKDAFKDFERFDEMYYYIDKLEGQLRNAGLHAAGICITPEPIVNYIGLEKRGGKTVIEGNEEVGADDGNDVVVTCFTGEEIGAMGLMKLDLLGLKTLDVMRDCEKLIGKRFNWEKMNTNDKKVFDLFSSGDLVGVFQFDSHGIRDLCKQIKFTSINDIIAINAIYRPGPLKSGMGKLFVERKNDSSKMTSIHPIVDKITEDSMGLVIFQESVMRILTDLGNLPIIDAEKIRKLISKSKGAESIEPYRQPFVTGAMKNGMSEIDSSILFNNILGWGNYSFNKSHSVSYSHIAFRTAYLKSHYPSQFYAAMLMHEKREEKVKNILKDMQKHGIKILPPDINKSGLSYKIDGEHLRAGFKGVKFLGDEAIENIIKNQPYSSITDLQNKVKLNKRAITNIILSGFFDKLHSRKQIYNSFKTGQLGQTTLFEAKDDWTPEEKNSRAADVYPLWLGNPVGKYEKDIKKFKNVEFITSDEIDAKKDKLSDKFGKINGIIIGYVTDSHQSSWGDWLKSKPETLTKNLAKYAWGSKWGKFTINDSDDKVKYCSIMPDVFKRLEQKFKKLKGKVIIVKFFTYKISSNLTVDDIVILDDFREHLKTEKYDDFERKLLETKSKVQRMDDVKNFL